MPHLFQRNRHRQQAANFFGKCAAEAMDQFYPLIKMAMPFALVSSCSAQSITYHPAVLNTSEPNDHHNAESNVELAAEVAAGAIFGTIALVACCISLMRYYRKYSHQHEHYDMHHTAINVSPDSPSSHSACDEEERQPIVEGYTSSACRL